MRHETLSRFAVEALRRIADGRKAMPDEAGGVRIGRTAVPPSVIRRLESRDLIRRTREGFAATEAGRAYLRRLAKPPRPPVGEPVEPARAQHMRLARSRDDRGRALGVINEAESPLGWLRRRRGRDGKPLLSDRQCQAGERLRADFEMAGLGPRITRAYDAPPIAKGARAAPDLPDPTEAQIDARRRLDRACAAMGPGLSDIALRVCCFLEGLEAAERALGWPVRSGKLVLGLALDRLADHYEGKKRAPEGARGARGCQ